MEFIRSLLFVPGVRQRFIERAPSSGADAVCLDLEDSVPPAEKASAREMVRSAIPTMPRTGYRLVVRVNGLDTGLLEADLEAVVGDGLDAVSLPKCHSVEVLRQVAAYLTFLEQTRGQAAGHVKLLPWIESPQALLHAEEILRASPRVIGASLGAEDYANSMGVMRTKGGKEVEWARYALAIACAAAGVLALDTPEMDFRDQEQLERDAAFARSIGFRGKYCIHPDQVAVVNRIFSPSEEELEFARKVVVAYREGERQGVGAVALEGTVVDWPVYTRALAILQALERQPQS
ncbi:MAG: CoA ester lyase [Chloroflexi bacterium]|nr:CoA ester lyase [Chloroflexota bacterium]